MLVLLAACAPHTGEVRDTAGDDAIELPACEGLVAPLPLDDGDDVLWAAARGRPDYPLFLAVTGTAQGLASEYCPDRITVDEATGAMRIEGPCEGDDGVALDGVLTWEGTVEDADTFHDSLSLEAFSLSWEFSFSGDGHQDFDADGGHWASSTDLRYTYAQADESAYDADLEIVSEFACDLEGGGPCTNDAYVRVHASPEGRAGDWCQTERLRLPEDCYRGDGWVAVQGAATGIAQWSCGDCAEVTLDGADAGEACHD